MRRMLTLLIALCATALMGQSAGTSLTNSPTVHSEFIILTGSAAWDAPLGTSYSSLDCLEWNADFRDIVSSATPKACNSPLAETLHRRWPFDIVITRIHAIVTGVVAGSVACGFQLHKTNGSVALGNELLIDGVIFGPAMISATVNTTIPKGTSVQLLGRTTTDTCQLGTGCVCGTGFSGVHFYLDYVRAG